MKRTCWNLMVLALVCVPATAQEESKPADRIRHGLEAAVAKLGMKVDGLVVRDIQGWTASEAHLRRSGQLARGCPVPKESGPNRPALIDRGSCGARPPA